MTRSIIGMRGTGRHRPGPRTGRAGLRQAVPASVPAAAVVPAALTALVTDFAEDRERADNVQQPPAPRDTG
ncbi:hypothetical protein ACH4T9_15800 [Micromonospora sp. NPDC020750]|uniref:hypothetical protein n=1 Tax=Micromonospora sp. NPDC020750 TaxID=3364239 RepID=UPI0037AD6F45